MKTMVMMMMNSFCSHRSLAILRLQSFLLESYTYLKQTKGFIRLPPTSVADIIRDPRRGATCLLHKVRFMPLRGLPKGTANLLGIHCFSADLLCATA